MNNKPNSIPSAGTKAKQMMRHQVAGYNACSRKAYFRKDRLYNFPDYNHKKLNTAFADF